MQTQVKTRFVKTSTIMRSAAFMRGVKEARKGIPMDYDAYSKPVELAMRWNYERGRQFGLVFDGDIKNGRTVRYEALLNWAAARDAKAVI
jgi:hypothetical protein